MPRIEKVMLLIAGVSLAIGAVLGFGHRHDSAESKGQVLEQVDAGAQLPAVQLAAPQPKVELSVQPVQAESAGGGEEAGAEDGSGS
jgi:hypothetical protein